MDNVSFVKNLYAAFGRGDIPSVLAAMSADIKIRRVGTLSVPTVLLVRNGKR